MFTKNAFNGKADPVADSIKSIAEADYALKLEALKGDQVKLDKNKNNKLDADDFKILRGKKKVEEAEEKPRSAGSVFDKDVAKSFQKKKPGESTGHDSKKTSTGTEYTKKAPKPEETNEATSFADKLKAGVKAGAKKAFRALGGPDDEGHRKDLQRKMGATGSQVHGKKSMAKYNEEFDLEAIDPALVEEFMQTEEFEQLDELSKETLKSYTKKADSQFADEVFKTSSTHDIRGNKKAMKRFYGTQAAKKRLKKEEVEEISELKKSTLASYVKKASTDLRDTGIDAGFSAHARYVSKSPKQYEKHSAAEKKSKDIAYKRDAGIHKATDRLAKEEVEQIEELSKETLKSYQDKAMKTPPSKNGNWVSRISGIARSAEKLKKEEVEQIEELSKTTLSNYKDAAKENRAGYHDSKNSGDKDEAEYAKKKIVKRSSGIADANKRLGEEIEQVEERSLTPAETAEKEKNVKGMKKNIAGFKARYGSRAKEVMYATATKQAKD